MFGQEIYGLGGLFQIVQLRPMGEACALLCLNVILDINEQADLSVLPFGWREGLDRPAIRAARASSV